MPPLYSCFNPTLNTVFPHFPIRIFKNATEFLFIAVSLMHTQGLFRFAFNVKAKYKLPVKPYPVLLPVRFSHIFEQQDFITSICPIPLPRREKEAIIKLFNII